MIYTEANPERSGEIWQYMHTINVAASSFHWDNVFIYNLTFRQLMSFKTHCSWAKIYNQGWNLAMRDLLGKVTSQVGQNGNSNSNAFNAKNRGGHDWRDDCYWRYNKNRCKYTNDECHFDHRCMYYGGWNHGFHNCRKCLKKEGSSHGKSSSSHKHSHKRR